MGWGEFFALSSALVWALAVILFRRSGETLPAFELNLFKNLFGLVLMVPTILLVEGLELPDYTSIELLLVFLSGLLGIAVADTWYLKALNMMGASRTGIVSSLFSPFVIFLSAVFLGERLVSWQWLGFILGDVRRVAGHLALASVCRGYGRCQKGCPIRCGCRIYDGCRCCHGKGHTGDTIIFMDR